MLLADFYQHLQYLDVILFSRFIYLRICQGKFYSRYNFFYIQSFLGAKLQHEWVKLLLRMKVYLLR